MRANVTGSRESPEELNGSERAAVVGHICRGSWFSVSASLASEQKGSQSKAQTCGDNGEQCFFQALFMGNETEHGREEQQTAVGKKGNDGAGFSRADAGTASRAAEKNGDDGGKPGSHERITSKAYGGRGRKKDEQHTGESQKGSAEHENEIAQNVAQSVAEETAEYGCDGKCREYKSGGMLLGSFDGEKQQTAPFGDGAL